MSDAEDEQLSVDEEGDEYDEEDESPVKKAKPEAAAATDKKPPAGGVPATAQAKMAATAGKRQGTATGIAVDRKPQVPTKP